ncbi:MULTISPECIES: hypothetical protein [Metallosphaera]|uniref:Uncharacterized protein n=3 Tax=Metallosphaera TaxID=41980 RepID=A4YDQ3_METS5|nr:MULTISPECIES: hypothetical protein [Metallosphaera]ABP94555.1 hypothetical protein Msed_0378 [Metallosphaera sedula DSM 5348]AIM26542.1 hypothetical protein HA72_0378 [Metallosphaera sedula]AKV73531.1 hypothetical protein MsedA_0391 [Metallosphaera sedula]AKV75773.1 hypothetical protein MsedB_0391 [Metallosphaera sedula]AKV78020.1 hypothetical protein MsedC_0390 [Metallosphaera sedula]
MVKKDSCGCVVERKYASDFLVRRFYALNGERGFRLVTRVNLDGQRWFEIYRRGEEIRYKSSECPLVIIGLEALLEAMEDGVTPENWREVLGRVKGLQINHVLEKLAEELAKVMEVEKSSVHS